MLDRPEGEQLRAQLRADVTKNLKKTLKAIEEINSCLDYDHLLTVYEPQSGLEMNQVIHRALTKGEIFFSFSFTCTFYLIKDRMIVSLFHNNLCRCNLTQNLLQ